MRDEDFPLIQRAVDKSGFLISEVVCGLAKGADTLGKKWGELNQIPVAEFPANWKLYGRAAGPIRNKQMLDYADGLIVFIWPDSKGSVNMLKQTVKARKPSFAVFNGEI